MATVALGMQTFADWIPSSCYPPVAFELWIGQVPFHRHMKHTVLTLFEGIHDNLVVDMFYKPTKIGTFVDDAEKEHTSFVDVLEHVKSSSGG